MLRITSNSWTKMRKFASITFSIQGSERISKPKTLFYIGNDLKFWARKNMPKELVFDHPSGVDVDGHENQRAFVGMINWYVPQEIDPQQVRPYIEEAIATELEPLGIQAQIEQFNQSNLYEANAFRIRVTENETELLQQQIPDVNVATSNGKRLLQLLGLNPSGPGTVGAQELLQRIQTARSQLSVATRPEETSDRMYNAPLNEDQLSSYLDDLGEVANIALQHFPNPVIQWD